jgi:hypothetical protein
MPSGFPDATCQRFVPGSLRGGAAIHARQRRKAVAAFERSNVSARSPYVRDHFDRDDAAISEAAKRAFLVADALVQDLPDQPTEPVGDRADGLAVSEAWDDPTVHGGEIKQFPNTPIYLNFELAPDGLVWGSRTREKIVETVRVDPDSGEVVQASPPHGPRVVSKSHRI